MRGQTNDRDRQWSKYHLQTGLDASAVSLIEDSLFRDSLTFSSSELGLHDYDS